MLLQALHSFLELQYPNLAGLITGSPSLKHTLSGKKDCFSSLKTWKKFIVNDLTTSPSQRNASCLIAANRRLPWQFLQNTENQQKGAKSVIPFIQFHAWLYVKVMNFCMNSLNSIFIYLRIYLYIARYIYIHQDLFVYVKFHISMLRLVYIKIHFHRDCDRLIWSTK